MAIRVSQPWPREFPTDSHRVRKLYCFCAVLDGSRYRFVRFTSSQKFAVLAD
jgi:transposase